MNTIEFSSAKNFEPLLAEALRAMGYAILPQGNSGAVLRFRDPETGSWCTFQNGQFSVPQGFDVDAVKQEFSKVVVRTAALKYGWTVKQDGNKMKVSKRA